MTKTEYAKYLASPEWKKLRNEYITECGGSCERCGLPRWLAELLYDQDVHVHHKTYANNGTNAEFGDLETLCRRCHEVETFGRSELKAPKEARCTACGQKHWDYRAKFCPQCEFMTGDTPDLYHSLTTFNPDHEMPNWKWVMRSLRVMVHYGEITAEELRSEAGGSIDKCQS